MAEPTELGLAKRLCQFAEVVPQVLNDFRPNILANYLFELANSFHAFYEACPVLKAEEPARSSRLALCDLTGRVLTTWTEIARDRGARKDVAHCDSERSRGISRYPEQPSRLTQIVREVSTALDMTEK